MPRPKKITIQARWMNKEIERFLGGLAFINTPYLRREMKLLFTQSIAWRLERWDDIYLH